MKYMNFFDIKLTSESIIHILIRTRFKYCIYYYDLMYNCLVSYYRWYYYILILLYLL